MELEFYRRMTLPLPRVCHKCRFIERPNIGINRNSGLAHASALAQEAGTEFTETKQVISIIKSTVPTNSKHPTPLTVPRSSIARRVIRARLFEKIAGV